MSRAEIAKKLRRLVVGDDVPLREPLQSYPHSGHENGTGHRWLVKMLTDDDDEIDFFSLFAFYDWG